MSNQQAKSVAIVTSTIGRAELERTIQSIKNQTYPCKHYIFVDGEQFAEKTKAIVEKYSDLVVTYLPMNTGANNWVNSSINAIAPYLIKEDIICYLDDDNWFSPNHIESVIDTFNQNENVDFVYALRNFISMSGEFICEDNTESLGFYENKIQEYFSFDIQLNDRRVNISGKFNAKYHIDTNCYAFLNKTAITLAPTWFSGINNDKNIFNKIVELNLKGVTTKKYTVNYVINNDKYLGISQAVAALGKGIEFEESLRKQEFHLLRELQKENIRRYDGKRPWAE